MWPQNREELDKTCKTLLRRPFSYKLRDDDRVQSLLTTCGGILSPCVHVPKPLPSQQFFASSRAAFSPLAPHALRNNMLLGFSHLRTTIRRRLMPIGCSHNHDMVVYITSTGLFDRSRKPYHRPPRAVMWPPNHYEMHKTCETLLRHPTLYPSRATMIKYSGYRRAMAPFYP